MSSGSRDLASDFINDPSDEEVFSMPKLDAPGVGELDFSESAGVSPLNAVLQWEDRVRLESLEAFLNDENTVQGMGVPAEAGREEALQPACMQRSVEMWPNAGGLVRKQLAALTRDAPALPYMIPFRRSFNHSPHVKRRRAPGRSLPGEPPAAAPGTAPRRRRSRTDAPKAGTIFEHRPLGHETSDANPKIIVEDFPSMFQHPFDASIVPVMYSLNRAHEPQTPPIRAHCKTFSAPAIYSTAVTTVPSPIHPVQKQDPLESTTVDSQCELPPSMSLEELQCHLMNIDQLRFDQTTTMSSTYGNHAHEALQEPMDIEYAPMTSADMECQVNFYNPSSTTITAHDPAQAEQVLRNRGLALGSNLEGVIDISSSNASSDCSILDMDLWGPIDSINPLADHIPERAAPQADLNDPDVESFRNPRLTWTPDLINRFEAAITLLGGPDKATPKSIVRCMACPQVSILNVKSRLQKFRLQAGMEVDTSRGTKRNHASTVPHERIPDDNFETDFILNQVFETCKDWTEQLEAQNLHMRHLLALHHTHTEVAKHNARVLEEFAARTSARLNNSQP